MREAENVDEAHASAWEEHMHSLDRESERPQNISDKIWQMMQSSDTKLGES